MFTVKAKESLSDMFKPSDYVIIGLISLSMGMFGYMFYRQNTQLKRITKIKFNELEKQGRKVKYETPVKRTAFKQTISKKLEILDKAYSKGYISKATYENTKERLQKLMRDSA